MQFEISTPVTNTNFFNREKDLARLLFNARNLIKGNPNWVALLGHRKVGKNKTVRLDEKTRCLENIFSMIR